MRGWLALRTPAVPLLAASQLTGAAVMALALAVRLPFLGGGQIDYDEGVYWQSLRNLAAGHPLFTAVYSSQPPGFLAMLLPFHVLLGGSIAGDRAGVLLLAMLGLGAAWRIGAALGGPWAGPAVAAAVAVDPLYLRQSVTLQADGPAVALALVALALAVESRRRAGEPGLALAAAAGAVLALALQTKLFAVAAGPAVALALAVAPHPAGAAGCRRSAWRRLAAALAGGLAGTGLVLLPFLGSLAVAWQQVVGYHLDARSVAVGGLDASLLPEIPIVVLGVAGAALAARRIPLLAAVGLAWALPAALLLAAQHPLWPHHVVLLTTALALLAGAGAASLLGVGPETGPRPAATLKARPRLAAGAVALAAAGCLLAVGSVRGQQTPDASREAVVAALQASTSPGDLVVTDDPYAAALAGRTTPAELVDATRLRESSGNLTPAQAEAVTARPQVRAVLLTTDRLVHLPGYQAWVARRFPAVRDLGPGRTLYLR